MKRNRIASWVLSTALTLSLVAVPAGASSFPDVADGHWARAFIEDMGKQGVFISVDDAGNFAPERTITASEILATCARISVESELRREIGEDRATQVKDLFGENQSWFHTEYAVCLEAGIVSYPELKELYQSGALTAPITKEDLAFFLVRAMQLEPMAQGLTTYSLEFKDKTKITAGREPYIYLLNMYKIVEGTDNGEFQPKSTVNRAVASTMLSRAMKFMEEWGTSVELPAYTNYDNWVSGAVVSAAAGSKGVMLLTLNSEFSGSKTISIPTETPIYENSMLAETSRLKAGVYARVNMDSEDNAIDVRLSGAVRTVSGDVLSITKDAVILGINGAPQTLSYNRFTEVQIGGKVGDRSLIDLEAGYAEVSCRIDQLGNMVAMKLAGGTHEADGILKSITTTPTGVTTLVVAGLDGQLEKLTISAGSSITANGLAVSAVDSSYVGSYLSMRINNDNPDTIVSAKVDTVTRYTQGAVKNVGTESGVNTVTITDLASNKTTTYKVTENATYFYNGAAIAHGGVQKDWFVTVRLSGGDLAGLWGYQGSVITEGTISGISYPAGTTKQVLNVARKSDGVVAPFELELKSPPEVRKGGKASSLDKLSTGDVVKVTVRYGEVTLVEAVAQNANLAGIIKEARQTESGVTLVVELDGGAGTNTYHVGSEVTVTQNDKVISVYDLRYGYHIALLATGEVVSSINVDKTPSSSNELVGTVIMVNTSEKTILFRETVSGGTEKIITVSIPTGTIIQDVTGGGVTSLSKLQNGDTLSIYGAYANDQFKATLVVKK